MKTKPRSNILNGKFCAKRIPFPKNLNPQLFHCQKKDKRILLCFSKLFYVGNSNSCIVLDVKQTQLHFLFIQTLCNAAHLHSRPQKNREKFEYHGVGYYTQTAQHPLYGFTLFTTETDISSLCLTLRFHSQSRWLYDLQALFL